MRTRTILLLSSVPLLATAIWLATRPANPTHYLDLTTNIRLPVGFTAELLYEVPKEQGSWVAMAFDPKGRLIVSDQDDKGVFRVTLPPAGSPNAKVEVQALSGFPYEPIPWGKRTVGGALGFLYAFDSLYMSTMKGFYRIRDTDGDDTFDEFTLLKQLNVGWEHSAHSIIVTEDQKALYLVVGNHTRVPDGVASRQPPAWACDSLLAPMPDPEGHAVGIEPPGGFICRITPDGSQWTMIASGLRNCVDLAIDRAGELFTYDSDLEFDIGSPWYRPTRILHVTSAAEFGWRAGSAKWPDYFADGNGAVLDIGPGSPTGIGFAYGSSFPLRYRDKLFVCDWTFGTIYTVDLHEDDSSYTATHEEFLSGAPLNIAAMRFGPDGNLYFVVGGRNTDSKLYRIRYVGPKEQTTVAVAPPTAARTENQAMRDLRHSLEAFHGSAAGGMRAITAAWPHLADDDRDIRYAARLAIECQDVDLWREKVFTETNRRAVIYATIALCRHADASLAERVLDKLGEVPFASLERTDRLALLRAYSLCFLRLGQPRGPGLARAIEQLDAEYPANDEVLNTELCRVLCYLDAPGVVDKTIALMQSTHTKTLAYDREMLARHEFGKRILQTMANTPNVQNIHYAYALRRVPNGWSLATRKHYFTWLNETLTKSGGQSFLGYIRAIRDDAIAHLPEQEAATISYLLGDVGGVELGNLPTPQGPAGEWNVDTAMGLFRGELRGRNYQHGKAMFSAGKCVACHRFEGTGGYAGPDLGSVGKRYSIRDIVQAICDPNATISEQYYASTVTLKDGNSLYGRIIYRTDTEVAVATNPFDFSRLTKVPAAQVVEVAPSQQSLMPGGLVYGMNREELMDLIAYLVSGGDERHTVFQ